MSTENRAVPSDIAEYQKFVADGGNDASAAELKTKTSEAADDADETDSDSETEDQATGEDRKGKKKSGFQRRVTRLNREIGARDARIAELEKQIGAPGAKRDETPAKTEPAAKAEPATIAKPKLDDFATYDEYVEAVSDWKVETKLAERETTKQQTEQQKAEQDKGKEITDAHNARVDEAKSRYDDWDKAFKGLDDSSFTDAMVVTIFESEVGPDITYHLAKNRDELARIAKLSPVRQAAELGKLETRFIKEAAADDADDEKPEPKPKTRVTTAPPPAKPLKGKASTSDAMPDPTDFTAYEAWARRKAANAHRN